MTYLFLLTFIIYENQIDLKETNIRNIIIMIVSFDIHKI
jgi:hypothetical protein